MSDEKNSNDAATKPTTIDRASQVPDEPGEEAFRRVVAIHLRLLNERHPGRRYRLVTRQEQQ